MKGQIAVSYTAEQIALEFLRLLGLQGCTYSSLTVICGAGVSYPPPAALPTVGTFIASALRHCTGDLSDHKAIWDAMKSSLEPTPRFEVLVNAISQLGVKPASVGALFDAVSPNMIHRLVAALGQAGAVIITTNFDNCIERALQDEFPRVVFQGIDLDKPQASRSILVKPHGSNPLNPSEATGGLVITIRELARTARGFRQFPVWREYLKSIIRNHTVVVIGYSGSDDFDITPILLESDPKQVVWIDYAQGIQIGASDIMTAIAPVRHICTSLPSAYLRGDIGQMVADIFAEPPITKIDFQPASPRKVDSWFKEIFPTDASKQAFLGVLFRHYGLHDFTIRRSESPLSTEALVQRGTAFYYVGRYDEACETLKLAASSSPTAAQRCQILFLLSSALTYSGDMSAALAESQSYVTLAEHLGDMGELQTAIVHEASLCYTMGNLEEARIRYQKVLDLQSKYASLQSAAMATWGLADIANASGLGNDAYEGYIEALELCRKLGSGQGVAWLNANLGELLLRGGCLTESESHLQQSVTFFEESGIAAGLLYALACIAQLEYCSIKAMDAKATIERCFPLLRKNLGSAALSTILLLSFVLAKDTQDPALVEMARHITANPVLQSAQRAQENEAENRWKLCRRILQAKTFDNELYADCRNFLLGPANNRQPVPTRRLTPSAKPE